MILLILLLAPFIIAIDHFHFHTEFSCRLTFKPNYTYHIRFREESWDVRNHTVKITDAAKQQIPAGGKKQATYNGTLNVDSGKAYHITAFIQHDCNLDGELELTYVVFSDDFCKVNGDGPCVVHFPMDLTGFVGRSYRQVEVGNVKEVPK